MHTNFTSLEELKKFFRKKVKALHPDRGGNPVQYREFIEWYQKILANWHRESPQKIRKISSLHTPKGNFIYKIVEFSVKELALALPKVIKLPILEGVCSHCHGKGFIKGKRDEVCHLCQGKGVITFEQNGKENPIELKCPVCSGEGIIHKERCPVCLGKGKTKKEIEVELKIPPGVRDGDILHITGETFSTAWDFYIEVYQSPDPLYKLEKDTLIYELEISFLDVLLKESITIETLEGKEEIPTALIKKGGPIVFTGRGPYLGEGDFWERGDLIINIRILFPEKLSPEARKYIEKVKKLMEV